MSVTDIKKGDRVRVTFEGTVRDQNPTYTSFNTGAGSGPVWAGEVRNELVTIEKIEPPVEVFKVGDKVRSRNLPEYTYHILRNGYVDLFNNVFQNSSAIFTSQSYERIE